MSVGKGSIKRAAGTAAKKPVEKKIVEKKNPPVKAEAKTVEKKVAKKAPDKATVKPVAKKAPAKKSTAPLPVNSSTSGIHYGVGSELPIFLM
jgi:hypothetical protein